MMENTVMGTNFLRQAGSGGGGGGGVGIIDLEHPIHHQVQHHNQQPPLHMTATLDNATTIPISLFDPSSIKPRPASDDEDDLPSSSSQKPHATAPSASPWHRMKWSDDMVRLLIHVVASVGDLDPCPDSTAKRKLPSAALQKKGKWKTVSKMMLEKGCSVSPQQCEDKFNDLNKRYKKLNDILGRGTTCHVVENPSLLDSMPHVSSKAKDDVRKILASKHLFYMEMSAYHNGQRIPTSPAAPPSRMEDGGQQEEEEGEEEEEDGDGGEEEEEEEERLSGGGGGDGRLESHAILRAEIEAVALGNGEKEMREWFRKRAMQLEEEMVEIEADGYELEKRRFKWQRFSRKKDRELERTRLEHERLGLENERMALELKHKEMELQVRMRRSSGFPD